MKSGAELVFLLPSCEPYDRKDEVGRRQGKAIEAFDAFGRRVDPDWKNFWDGFEEEYDSQVTTRVWHREPSLRLHCEIDGSKWPGPAHGDLDDRLRAIERNLRINRRSLAFKGGHWDETTFNFLVKHSKLTVEV